MDSLRRLRPRPSFANVVSLLALFVALGGTSYAAIVITGANVKDNTLTGADVKNGSLLRNDFKAGQLPAGAKGATGAPGAKGDMGAAGAAGTNGVNGSNGANGADGSPDTAAQVLTKLLGVDGAGSGLDADTVDGVSGAGFQRAYVRTIVVGGESTAVANGTEFVAALAGITGSSATSPYLIELEPGVYDIGSEQLTMKPYVDIEGSGEGITTVTGSYAGGVPKMVTLDGGRVELRHLTLRATGATDMIGAHVTGSGAALFLRDAALDVTGSGLTAGISTMTSGTAHAINTYVSVQGSGAQGATGALSNGGSAMLWWSRFLVTSSGSGNASGFVVVSGGVSANDVFLETSATGGGDAVAARSIGGSTTIDRSSVQGNLVDGAGTLSIGGSRIDGTPSGSPVCVATYKTNYTAAMADCS